MLAKRISRRLKRERTRLLNVVYALRDPLINLIWDRYRDRWIQVHQGCLPASGNVAVFLAYQPRSVSEETYASLAALRRAGFTPIVVLNHPVREQDRARIAEHTHLFCSRPNLGYDFGGYRDGLYVLKRHAGVVENLILANDSVIFPLFEDTGFVSRMIQRGGSFNAVTSSEGVEGYRPYDRACADYERGLPPMPGRYCASSYFLLFKNRPFDDPVFTTFWSGYRMTSSRRQTILRGEIGLTRHFRCHGIEPTILYDVSYISDCLAVIEISQLPEVLSGLQLRWKSWEDERDRLLYRAADGLPGWAGDARRFILLSILNGYVLHTAARLNDDVLHIPFRKKKLNG
ncbi:MAG: rhamnan synthesis F family protein [Nitrospiraceae bacterium]